MCNEIPEKKTLREHFRSLRVSIPHNRRIQAANSLASFVSSLPPKSCVVSFISFQTEIDLHPANQILLHHHSLALPQIQGHDLIPVYIPSLAILEQISHPKNLGPYSLSPVPIEHITHVLVPGLAFDPQGYRLGYGGGYYDRWLSLHPQIFSIGVGFQEQLTPSLIREDHDVPVSQLLLV